jgi:hypothetical protein
MDLIRELSSGGEKVNKSQQGEGEAYKSLIKNRMLRRAGDRMIKRGFQNEFQRMFKIG